MYAPQFINRHEQFGSVNYDLILTDSDGVLPPVRTAVSFTARDDTREKRASLAGAVIQTRIDSFRQTVNEQAVQKMIEAAGAAVLQYVEADPTPAKVQTVSDLLDGISEQWQLPTGLGLENVVRDRLEQYIERTLVEIKARGVTDEVVANVKITIEEALARLGGGR
jgi:hypothetical protein